MLSAIVSNLTVDYRLPPLLWNARGEKKHKVHVERGGEYR